MQPGMRVPGGGVRMENDEMRLRASSWEQLARLMQDRGISAEQGYFTLKNTLMSNNMPHGNCSGARITSSGGNLSNDSSCNFTQPNDQQNVDPKLGPLQDNGGPTFTHAL